MHCDRSVFTGQDDTANIQTRLDMIALLGYEQFHLLFLRHLAHKFRHVYMTFIVSGSSSSSASSSLCCSLRRNENSFF